MINSPRIKITMLKTKKGLFDPFRLFCFKAGKTYKVPYSLAQRYIEQGNAKLYEPEQKVEIKETKKKKKK